MSLFFLLSTNWKFNCTRVTKTHPNWANQRNPSGNQETVAICGLTFQVIHKLLRVTLRPSNTPPPSLKKKENEKKRKKEKKYQTEFIKNVLIRGPRPHSYHNHATRPKRLDVFFNGPLQIVENKDLSLAPDNPRKTASPFKKNQMRLKVISLSLSLLCFALMNQTGYLCQTQDKATLGLG